MIAATDALPVRTRLWLPAGALTGGAPERALAPAVAAWSRAWFGAGPVSFGAGGSSAEPRRLVRGVEDGLAVAAAEPELLRMAGLMLDAAIDPGALRPADRQLLERLWDGCLDDLCARVGRALSLAERRQWRDGLPADAPAAEAWLDLPIASAAGEPLLSLLVSPDLAVQLVRDALPPSPLPQRLQPLRIALARQDVGFSALVGSCEVTLGELSGLAEGDVLVLDRWLDSPLETALNGEVKTGRCALEQEGDALRVRLLEPLSG